VDRKYVIVLRSKDDNTLIGVDCQDRPTIDGYLFQDEKHAKKYRTIAGAILERIPYPQLYKWEKLSDEIKNVWAMRFFVKAENDRIYCQEKYEGKKKTVIMSILHLHKETMENSPREIAAITKASKYSYIEVEDCDPKKITTTDKNQGDKKSNKNKKYYGKKR
jgi:hypothetical protein